MLKVIPTETLAWVTASKTKPIMARPLETLVADQDVASKLLLNTLEGTQGLKANSMVCMGTAKNDIWQQTLPKLLKQYEVQDLVAGWFICQPKPENERNVVEVTSDMCDDGGNFVIVAQWGEPHPGMPGVVIQNGKAGDFILQNQDDPSDVWVVRRAFFQDTYELTK